MGWSMIPRGRGWGCCTNLMSRKVSGFFPGLNPWVLGDNNDNVGSRIGLIDWIGDRLGDDRRAHLDSQGKGLPG